MTNENHRNLQDREEDQDDDVIPRASEDEVLDETARMVREGRKELESDPREHKPRPE